ncbi:siderophore ABC transporter substrate-binding protein [Leucobacter iarius]|uniref:ABC transporter substrate-binding protein n=1 Tax=Leucobacter iarius TaxID=333963 RepID=A0ABP4XTC7_9MICO
MSVPRLLAVSTLGVAAVLAITGCSGAKPAAETEKPAAKSVTVEDNSGKHTVQTPPKSVVATDNRTFQTLSDWGVQLSAAAVSLMPDTVSYKTQKGLVDLGTHREPNLELLVAAKPDLVINGQRYQGFHDEIVKLAPDATVLELDPRDGKPFDSELKRQVTVLGEVFGKQTEAKKLVADFDKAVDRAKKAYKSSDTVLAVNTSGGAIGNIAPTVGRTLGPVYDLIGLTPALKVEKSSEGHKGDEISVEAIASANPDWILVMDRDASFDKAERGADYKPAAEILEKNDALKNVKAVANKHIVYMPTDTYLNEGIQTYTEFLNDFADALEKSKA